MEMKQVKRVAMVGMVAMAIAVAPFKAKAEEPRPAAPVVQTVPVTWNDAGHFFTAAAPAELSQMIQLKVGMTKDGDVGSAARVVKKIGDKAAIRAMTGFDATGNHTGTTIDAAVGDGGLAAGAAVDLVPDKDGKLGAQGRLAVMKSLLLKVIGIRLVGELAGDKPAGYVETNIPASGTTVSAYLTKDSRTYGIDQDIGPVTVFAAGDEKGNLSGGVATYPKFGHVVIRCEDGVFAAKVDAKPAACGIIGGFKF
ncbi:MAG: hypothetical protein V1492_00905 [Candidatus Micrarchaeota archaeon]